ncbi:STAS domain-containing protein [Amycolatopsis sp. lyj-112]|uniref:STAS domain-containing protein n=1 Tax=Amycolatopsis sp. lyj-112 TaxID=2789288 RepID=UPI00397A3727
MNDQPVVSAAVPRPRLPADALLQVRRTRWSEDLLVVSAAGEIDLATAGHLERALWDDLPAATVLDLTDVSFLGVAGLRVLEAAANRAHVERRTVGIVASTRLVMRLLRLFDVDVRIPVYRYLPDAVRELPKLRNRPAAATWKAPFSAPAGE